MDNLTEESNWGIVELMGHKVVAGKISKSEMLGKPMLRVDVPATSAFGEFTQFYRESAIYCVTFVSEQVALMTAEANKVNPVSVYVPDLITREAHEKTVQTYRDQIARLNRGLPAPNGTNTCTWTRSTDWDEGDTYNTSCGHTWQFEDGTPADNEVKYCTFCGQPVQVEEVDNDDDEEHDEDNEAMD